MKSITTYSTEVYDCCYSSKLEMLNVIQRWSLKIVFNKPEGYPNESIYNESELCNKRQLF